MAGRRMTPGLRGRSSRLLGSGGCSSPVQLPLQLLRSRRGTRESLRESSGAPRGGRVLSWESRRWKTLWHRLQLRLQLLAQTGRGCVENKRR